MIDAGPSLNAAEGLSGQELALYLVGHGWSARPSRVDGVSIFSKELKGADRVAEFILPVKPGFDDEQMRVADALRTIEAIERRPLAEIAKEIAAPTVTVQADDRLEWGELMEFQEDGWGLLEGVEVLGIEIIETGTGGFALIRKDKDTRQKLHAPVLKIIKAKQ